MDIKYYFFETNDLETIESKIPFKEKGEDAIKEEEDLSFSIERSNNQYIGLALEIKSKSDIFLSVDFYKKESSKSNTNYTTLIIILVIVGILILLGIIIFYKFKHNKKTKDISINDSFQPGISMVNERLYDEASEENYETITDKGDIINKDNYKSQTPELNQQNAFQERKSSIKPIFNCEEAPTAFAPMANDPLDSEPIGNITKGFDKP